MLQARVKAHVRKIMQVSLVHADPTCVLYGVVQEHVLSDKQNVGPVCTVEGITPARDVVDYAGGIRPCVGNVLIYVQEGRVSGVLLQ